MLARFVGGDVELFFAPDERVPPPGAPTGGYATLGDRAPTAWPSGFPGLAHTLPGISGSESGSSEPVRGELSEHAKAALKRMGIVTD